MTGHTPDRYRRTSEAEALQWTGSNADQLRALCGADFGEIAPEDRVEDPDQTAAVRTNPHGGWLGLKPGDWVLKHAGHFTTASDEEFRAEWEPVVPVLPPVSRADDAAWLRDRVLDLEAQLAGMRDLLRVENKRANDAIDREETAEQAAVEAQQDQADVYAEVAELVRSMAPEHPRNASWVQDCHTIADRIDEARPALRRMADQAPPARLADVSTWAISLGADGLEPSTDTITLDGRDDQPFIRMHFAFHSDMPEKDRQRFCTGLTQLLAKSL